MLSDYNSVFETLLIAQDEKPNAYDDPTADELKEMLIEFNARFPKMSRETRLQLINDLTGRKLLSTKDMRMGEIDVLRKLLRNNAFIAEMREEYARVQQR